MRFRVAVAFLLTCVAAAGAVYPRLSLEQLVDESQYIVHGHITGRRVSWDESHRYIWTRYQLLIADALKSSPPAIIEISEPGGILDGIGMQVDGTAAFSRNEEVVLFLYRTPIGYYRLTGEGQGKYTVVTDPSTGARRLHGNLAGMTLMDPAAKQAAQRETSLTTLDGAALDQFNARIRALVAGRK